MAYLFDDDFFIPPGFPAFPNYPYYTEADEILIDTIKKDQTKIIDIDYLKTDIKSLAKLN